MNFSKIEIFPAMDRQNKKPDGKICSEYPCWYLKSQIAAELEDIRMEKDNYKRFKEDYGPVKRVKLLKILKLREDRLKDIMNSKPTLSDKQKDALWKEYNRLGEQIKNSLFDRSSMQLGNVRVAEEARRCTSPIIDVDGRNELFEALNIKIEKGMISRNGAIKAWKIIGALLDEDRDAENLRKDFNTGTFKLLQTFQDLINQTG